MFILYVLAYGSHLEREVRAFHPLQSSFMTGFFLQIIDGKNRQTSNK